jgi:hypothetical protein
MKTITRKIVGFLLVGLGIGIMCCSYPCGLVVNFYQLYLCGFLLLIGFTTICIGYGNIMKAIRHSDSDKNL